jgi:hypothetical protein
MNQNSKCNIAFLIACGMPSLLLSVTGCGADVQEQESLKAP